MAQDQPTPKQMQLAEILSDLVSLRVCDPNAALALVSARSAPAAVDTAQQQQEEPDAELQRAKDLVKLHFQVKEAEKKRVLSGVLEEARAAVERAVGG